MARARQCPRLILAVVCLPVFVGALDLTIVSAVLPKVIRSMTVDVQKLWFSYETPIYRGYSMMTVTPDMFPGGPVRAAAAIY